jgi:hypothetical protein
VAYNALPGAAGGKGRIELFNSLRYTKWMDDTTIQAALDQEQEPPLKRLVVDYKRPLIHALVKLIGSRLLGTS